MYIKKYEASYIPILIVGGAGSLAGLVIWFLNDLSHASLLGSGL
jgi:hypothetical protein